jgi:hypothetical protein
MTPITPTIRLLTLQDTEDAGIQLQTLILEFNGNNYHLPGYTGDTIHVYQQSICLYVLTSNKLRGYVGLNTYMAPEPDSINSVCLHTAQDISHALGPKWEELSPLEMTLKLIDYLI